jgi:hypothetical protein
MIGTSLLLERRNIGVHGCSQLLQNSGSAMTVSKIGSG